MLKRLGWLLCLVPGLLFAQNNVAGQWLVTYVSQDVWYYYTLTLTVDNGKLGGNLNGAEIEGAVSGNAIHFVARDKRGKGRTTEYAGTLSGGDTMSLRAEGDPGTFNLRRMPQRPPGPPQRHEFTPTTFYRQFSAQNKPVLRVWPGDTVHTTTVDSGGTDGNGIGHGPGGNPQTGPFYIETAMPGDTLAIHFNRVRLNRDSAVTSAALVERVLTPGLAAKIKDLRGPVLWHLDHERGVATLKDPGEHLKNLAIPLRPMMGCVAVAPRNTPFPAGDSGNFGGNMDLNEIVEGSTVYLFVTEPGALLYMGDGHAVMGDGEITGSGLETSMDVEFTVNIVPSVIGVPHVETPTHLIVLGLAGSLDEAIRSATDGMVQWLQKDYKLTVPEAVQLLGAAVEYSVGEVADRNASIAAKINKKYLASLAPAKP